MPVKLPGSTKTASTPSNRREKIYVFSAVALFFAGLTVAVVLYDWKPGSIAGDKSLFSKDPTLAAFDMPPIVVQLPGGLNGESRSMVIDAALEFEADSIQEANASVRTTKMVLPIILDRIITGMRTDAGAASGNASAVNQYVLDRSNEVLAEYGVTAASLRMDGLHYR